MIRKDLLLIEICVLFFCFAGKPDGHTESQEAHHVSDTNNGQSSKPASRDAVCDNISSVASVTGPSVTKCAELQGREVLLVVPPCYTNVSAVMQTTTVCDQAKITSFHSDGTSLHVKRDSLVKSVSKAREIKRCDNGPYDRNLYKLFSSYPSTDVRKRGIKRSADDCVEPLFFKKIKTERQD